jgi:hypothetical protein
MMTLEEIEQSLPNGLHDAQIVSIALDYVRREAKFELEILLSDGEKEEADSYQAATLTFSRFVYCVIEAPDSKYPYQVGKELWVNAGSHKSSHVSSIQLPDPPEGAFTMWFFVNDWNSFIHVAAFDAEIAQH